MSEEEIKKLSREYADDTVESYGFSAETVEELKEEQANVALSVISFLLRDYCIVPKEQIRTMQKDLKDSHFTFIGDKLRVEGALIMLEKIFPDLFEQKGE